MSELTVVQQFRESHHAVARMFASGMTPSMIRQRSGYSLRRLSLLWNDPTFQELIKIYAKRVGEAWDRNMDTYLDLGVSNMIRAEALVAEALDNDDDPPPLLALDRISQGRADRFGYGKHNTVEHKFDFATLLDKAIARSGKAVEVKQIEGRASIPPEKALPDLQGAQPIQAPKPTTQRAVPRSIAAVLNPIKRRRVA